MKKIVFSLMAACAALMFCSCDPNENNEVPSKEVLGSWRLESCLIEIKTTLDGNTNTTSNTTDYSADRVYLILNDMFRATGYYNLEMKTSVYNYESIKGTIRFLDGISVSDNGKAMVLVGSYNCEVSGNKMTLKQYLGIEEANEQTTYTFHREDRND